MPPALTLHLSNRNPIDAQPTGLPSFRRSFCPEQGIRSLPGTPTEAHPKADSASSWASGAPRPSPQRPEMGRSHGWRDEMLMENRPGSRLCMPPLERKAGDLPTLTLQWDPAAPPSLGIPGGPLAPRVNLQPSTSLLCLWSANLLPWKQAKNKMGSQSPAPCTEVKTN